jgi:hypothetical protein
MQEGDKTITHAEVMAAGNDAPVDDGAAARSAVLELLCNACTGLLRARPALLHDEGSGAATATAAAAGDGDGGAGDAAEGARPDWRCCGALAGALKRCTELRLQLPSGSAGADAADSACKALSDGSKNVLLALSPSPRCAEVLQGRGLELETLIFGAEKAEAKRTGGSVPPSPTATASAPPGDGGQRDEI